MNISNIHIFDLLILLGAIQGILFVLFLVTRPLSNRKASFFLSLFIFAFSINSFYNTLEGMGIRNGAMTNPMNYIPLYCSLLVIAAFHYFVIYLIQPNRLLTKKDSLLFLPYIFQFGFMIFCLFGALFSKEFMLRNIEPIIGVFNMIDLIAVVFGLTVLILAIKKINRYESNLLKNYSEVSTISLRWLKQLIFLLFIIWFLFAIPTIYEQMANKPSIEIFYPMWIAMSILFYWIGYTTYARKDLFKVKMFHEVKEAEKNSKILSEKTGDYYQNLLKLMAEEKTYLNPDLNLKMLADTLGLSSGYLSQIINQYEQKNFFDFVNSYRVNAVKEKLNDPKLDHLSILGIAFDAGFKSKSTFNLTFKKLTGETPSDFKRGLFLMNKS